MPIPAVQGMAGLMSCNCLSQSFASGDFRSKGLARPLVKKVAAVCVVPSC